MISIPASSATWPAGPGRPSGELTEVLNTQSGLLGLSGVGSDMRTVQAAAAQGDERARLALEVFVHRLAKAIAGLVTSLERLDALVFTGGIGENSAVVRGLVLRRLGFLGLAEDPEANTGHGRSTRGRISHPGPVQALVVPTDEELMIARDTARLVAGAAIASWNSRPSERVQHRREEGKPVTENDYIVVGGGTAGCVVAARLTEDARHSGAAAGGGERRTDRAMTVPDAWPQLLGTPADWAGVTIDQADAGPVAYPGAGPWAGPA